MPSDDPARRPDPRFNGYPPDALDEAARDAPSRAAHRRPPGLAAEYLGPVVVFVLLAGVVVWLTLSLTVGDSSISDPGPSQAATTSSAKSSPAPTLAFDPAMAPTGVQILNGSGVESFGPRTRTTLVDVGFKKVTTAAYKGSAVSRSTVFFKSGKDERAAEFIAQRLGFDEARQSAAYVGEISVVLRSDLDPAVLDG